MSHLKTLATSVYQYLYGMVPSSAKRGRWNASSCLHPAATAGHHRHSPPIVTSPSVQHQCRILRDMLLLLLRVRSDCGARHQVARVGVWSQRRLPTGNYLPRYTSPLSPFAGADISLRCKRGRRFDNDYEAFHIPLLMFKRTIRTQDDWTRVRVAE